MKSRNLMVPALLAVLALPAFAVDFDNNPPGPMGGLGASPNKRLSAEQRQRLRAMSPQDRHAFMQEWRQKYGDCWRDRDNNPPGPRGGPGTNWENPPGPRGGPGTSPDRRSMR